MPGSSANPLLRWLPWVIAGVSLVALAVVIARTGSRDAKLEELAQRVEAIDRGTDPDAPARGASRGARGISAQGGVTAARRRDRGRELSPQQQAAEIERQRRMLEAEFKADAPDPGSNPLVTQLEDTVVGKDMAATGLAPQDLSIECRQSLCRIAGEFARGGDAEDWATMYLSAAGGRIQRARTAQVRQPDGSVQVIIYGTRAPTTR